MNRNLNRRIHPIAEADGLSPKKPRKIDMIKLPSDADEKLIGKHIDWTDEHVKID